ncbi:hypothetical protein [Clostridium pasteurianum]|uniref:Tyrosine specific protein phosphatases domain-containing protein n=1 Tax=Clostridium pasteurianum BC1 TaxID=86416 RepID=R4K5A8_CLOPA|nr:hypothetical protein [Clostridium pasteurianum]AGK95714.1 hypothetical protein Clopa_0672 [Clostridium pasteurianum BC1]
MENLVKLYPIVDTVNAYEFPKRFRTTKAPVDLETEELPNLNGLEELQASASGRFSRKGLQLIKDIIGNVAITIVDLRQESHGYVNDMAISWYGEQNGANRGLRPEEIKERERNLLNELICSNSIIFGEVEGKSACVPDPINDPKIVQSEEEMVKAEGCGYMRFYVTDHHVPSDSELDRFIEFVKIVPQGQWLHFHCRGGSGRASTFIDFYDIIRNAKYVSLEDILTRQALIGGKDFRNNIAHKDLSKRKAAIERIDFIAKFYDYCMDNYETNFQVLWSQWLKKEKAII